MFGRLLDYVMGLLALLRKLSTIMPMMLPPPCVIVDVGKSWYTGPSCFEEGDEVVTAGGCVPIFPRTEQWETVDGGGKDKKTTHSRYAWTLFGKPRDKPSRRRSS